jgi:hypothetical protein
MLLHVMVCIITVLNSCYREEIERKTRALATYGGFTESSKVDELIGRAWNLENEKHLNGFIF